MKRSDASTEVKHTDRMLFWIMAAPILWCAFLTVLVLWTGGGWRGLGVGLSSLGPAVVCAFMAAHHALNVGCDCESDEQESDDGRQASTHAAPSAAHSNASDPHAAASDLEAAGQSSGNREP